MKTITSMAPTGIHYIDEESTPQFVDFERCYQNYVMDLRIRMGPRFTAHEEEFYKRHKSVGFRHAMTTPQTIWFYADSPVEFVFETKDSFWEVIVWIKKAGYRTTDGD
jgi:hypothetical protein